MTVMIALVAALLAGAGLVLQQRAAEQAPKAHFLRLRLIADLIRRPRWLAGIAVMAAGQLLSVWVLGHLDLSVAEPLLAASLIFALLLAAPLSGQRLRATELVGALVLSLGVTVLSVTRTVSSQGARFGSFAYWPAAAGIAALAWLFVLAGRRRSGQQRATLTGCAAGLVFGISDALTRRTVQIADAHSLLAVLTSWPGYCLAAAALIGLWLMESAFNAAPLHASLPAITAAEPLAGIALGVLVFGDMVRVSAGMIVLQAAGLAAIVAGVIMVARAPALSSLRPARLIRTQQAAARTATVSLTARLPAAPGAAEADRPAANPAAALGD
jgi:drug/metabolite transporter (DMT)-like permease